MEIPDYPNISEWAVPFYIVTMLVELGIGWFTGRVRYETRDTLASLVMGGGSLLAGALTAGAIGTVSLWLYEHRLFTFGFEPWWIVLAFVLDDLRYYWVHRFGHEIRWLWAAHIVHHSSQHYNLSTALRQTWTSFFALWWVVRLPLVFLGLHPAVLAFCGGINLVYQYWIHTEAIRRFPPWFEAIMNTPSHHRVHHATNPRYLDANYAGTFIVWDRLFGTFVPEDDAEPCRYGIVKSLGTFNPLRIALHEWVGIARDATGLSLRQRLGYLIGPPGWSHDGSRKTSADLKREHLRRHPEEAGKPGRPEVA